jgi:hypothetical protein
MAAIYVIFDPPLAGPQKYVCPQGTRILFFKVWWQLPVFIFILSFTVTYIHNYIRTIHSSISIRRGLSPFFVIAFAQREKPPWGAEPGFELGPSVQQTSALTTELCCTLKSYAAP